MIVEVSYLSILINVIVQKYLISGNSICVFWNNKLDYQLSQSTSIQSNYAQIVSVNIDHEWNTFLKYRKRLLEVLDSTTCERFVVFGSDILMFLNTFVNVSARIEKRSRFHKFLLIYDDEMTKSAEKEVIDHKLLKFLPNTLIIQEISKSEYCLWTKRFIGITAAEQNELILLDKYFGFNNSFLYDACLYPDKIYDMMGRPIFLGTFDYRPFAVTSYELEPKEYIQISNGTSQPIFIDGTEARYVIEFCKRHNCSIQIFIEEFKEWGTAIDDTHGEGLLGSLIDGKTEIVINAFYLWHKEYTHFDISDTFSRSGVTNLVPLPLTKATFLLPFQPFSWYLWLAIFACLVLEFIGLSYTYWKQANKLNPKIGMESYEYGFGVMLRIFLSQGFNDYANAGPLRIILFSCLIIDLITGSVYSGGLASILTLPAFDEPTDTVERLVRHNMKWTGTFINWIFSIEKSQDPQIRHVIDQFIVDTEASLRKWAYTKNIGFVVERLSYGHYSVPDYIEGKASERFQVMKEDLYYEYCVAFVPKLWPFLENFNKIILRAHETGLDKFWEWQVSLKYLDNYVQKTLTFNNNPSDPGPQKLALSNFIGILLLWIVGIIGSIIIFFIEMIIFRRNLRKRNSLKV